MNSYIVDYPNGSHVELNNCDCFEYISHMKDNSVDNVFTSPPYNRKRNDKYSEYDDTLDNYYEFLCDLVDSLLPKTKKYIFLNIQTNYYNRVDVHRFIGKYAEQIQNIIIWGKTNPMPANGNNITNSYEYFFVIGKTSLKSNSTYTKNIISTSVNNVKNNVGHKAVMKQEIANWFIQNFTQENDIVFDPFMGLGTTAIACQNNKRNCIGTEMVEAYYLYSIGNLEVNQTN